MVLIYCLFTFSVSAELGDFDPETHTPGFISEFRFIANQTEELELAIYEAFQEMKYVISLYFNPSLFCHSYYFVLVLYNHKDL